jgi:hypothetical protein
LAPASGESGWANIEGDDIKVRLSEIDISSITQLDY